MSSGFFYADPLSLLRRFVRRFNLPTGMLSSWSGVSRCTVVRSIRSANGKNDVGYFKVLAILKGAEELCRQDPEWKDALAEFLQEENTKK